MKTKNRNGSADEATFSNFAACPKSFSALDSDSFISRKCPGLIIVKSIPFPELFFFSSFLVTKELNLAAKFSRSLFAMLHNLEEEETIEIYLIFQLMQEIFEYFAYFRTTVNSIRATNTNTMQVTIQMSNAVR